ncbi:cell division protein ZapA [Clostridium sp. UBA4548]|uniref:cell division protein ZapA n=1 Tax=Clostridium sp. UBA4548 TaxID=1946361 RepID=UPI0025C4212B|nr:cell division protein ZapA [Clostridium sp. UBA4548]
MNIITVRINGMEYNLKAEENDAYLHMVARYVDKKISTLMENNPKISRPDATILAALNLGDESFKSREAYERLNENYKTLLNEQKSLISEIERLKAALEGISMQKVDLESKLSNSENLQQDSLKEELKSMSEQMDIMKAIVKEVQEENQKLKEENERNATYNKMLFSEKRRLGDEVCDKNRKIKDLLKEVEVKNIEILHEKHKKIPFLK